MEPELNTVAEGNPEPANPPTATENEMRAEPEGGAVASDGGAERPVEPVVPVENTESVEEHRNAETLTQEHAAETAIPPENPVTEQQQQPPPDHAEVREEIEITNEGNTAASEPEPPQPEKADEPDHTTTISADGEETISEGASDTPKADENQRSSADQPRKRSRADSMGSASSLNYKVPSSIQSQQSKLVTPPREMKTDQQQQHDAHQQASRPLSPPLTRARGGSGIPPRKLELADLEGLTEEEIVQALMDDPELAAQAAAAAEKIKESSATGSGSKKSKKKYYRTPDGNIITDPLLLGEDRLSKMKDQGVPVMQWIVVLLLVGVTLYQLYKILSVPTAKPGGTTKKSVDKQVSSGKSTKKAKGKGKSSPSSGDIKVVEKVVAEIEGIDGDAAGGKSADKKSPKKKAVKKPKAAPSTATPKKASEPASAKSNGSTERLPLTAPVLTQSLDEDDEGGWEPVKGGNKPTSAPENGATAEAASTPTKAKPKKEKKKKSEAVKTSEEPAVKEAAPEEQPVVEPAPKVEETPVPPAKEPAVVEETPAPVVKEEPAPVAEEEPENGKSAAADGVTATKNKNKKKKKKSKASEGSADGGPTTPVSVEADEALALQLQREEESYAKKADEDTVEVEPQEDVWEEVPKKKRATIKA